MNDKTTALFVIIVALIFLSMETKENEAIITDNWETSTSLKDNPKQKSLIDILPTDNSEQVEAKKYLQRFAKVAKVEQRKYGVPASIKLAQGLIESGKGKSYLATKANNHFGIKCFSKKCAKGHCVNRTDDSHKDFFVSYQTAWESYRAHSKLLNRPRYKVCHECEDYKCWAKCLKKQGYATAPNYAKELISVVEKYRLYNL